MLPFPMTLRNCLRQRRLRSLLSPAPASLVTRAFFISSASFTPSIPSIPFRINTLRTLSGHGAPLCLLFSYPCALFSLQRRVYPVSHSKFSSLSRHVALTMVRLSLTRLTPAQPNSSDSVLCLIPPAPVTPLSAILTRPPISGASKRLSGSLTSLNATLTKNAGVLHNSTLPFFLACPDLFRPDRNPLGYTFLLGARPRITGHGSRPFSRLPRLGRGHSPLTTFSP